MLQVGDTTKAENSTRELPREGSSSKRHRCGGLEVTSRREEVSPPPHPPHPPHPPRDLLQDFTRRSAAAAAPTPTQQACTASPLPLPPAAAAGAAPSPPSLLRDDPSCRLWHKTDGQFRKPKLNVQILLSSPVLHESPESRVSRLG